MAIKNIILPKLEYKKRSSFMYSLLDNTELTCVLFNDVYWDGANLTSTFPPPKSLRSRFTAGADITIPSNSYDFTFNPFLSLPILNRSTESVIISIPISLKEQASLYTNNIYNLTSGVITNGTDNLIYFETDASAGEVIDRTDDPSTVFYISFQFNTSLDIDDTKLNKYLSNAKIIYDGTDYNYVEDYRSIADPASPAALISHNKELGSAFTSVSSTGDNLSQSTNPKGLVTYSKLKEIDSSIDTEYRQLLSNKVKSNILDEDVNCDFNLGTYPLLGYKDGVALTGADVEDNPAETRAARIRSGTNPFIFFDGYTYYLTSTSLLNSRITPGRPLGRQTAALAYNTSPLENHNRYGGSLPLSIRMYTKSLFHFSDLDGLTEPQEPLPTDRIKNAASYSVSLLRASPSSDTSISRQRTEPSITGLLFTDLDAITYGDLQEKRKNIVIDIDYNIKIPLVIKNSDSTVNINKTEEQLVLYGLANKYPLDNFSQLRKTYYPNRLNVYKADTGEYLQALDAFSNYKDNVDVFISVKLFANTITSDGNFSVGRLNEYSDIDVITGRVDKTFSEADSITTRNNKRVNTPLSDPILEGNNQFFFSQARSADFSSLNTGMGYDILNIPISSFTESEDNTLVKDRNIPDYITYNIKKNISIADLSDGDLASMYYHPTNTPRHVDISSLSSQRINDLQVVISKARLCSSCDLIEDNPRTTSVETNHYHPWAVCQRSILLDKDYAGMVENSIQGDVDFRTIDGGLPTSITFSGIQSPISIRLQEDILTAADVEYKYLNVGDPPAFNPANQFVLHFFNAETNKRGLIYVYSYDSLEGQNRTSVHTFNLFERGTIVLIASTAPDKFNLYDINVNGSYTVIRADGTSNYTLTLTKTTLENRRIILAWRASARTGLTAGPLTLTFTPRKNLAIGRGITESFIPTTETILNPSFYYRNILGLLKTPINREIAFASEEFSHAVFSNESKPPLQQIKDLHQSYYKYDVPGNPTDARFGYSNEVLFADPTDRTRLHTVFDGGGDIILQAGSEAKLYIKDGE